MKSLATVAVLVLAAALLTGVAKIRDQKPDGRSPWPHDPNAYYGVSVEDYIGQLDGPEAVTKSIARQGEFE